MFTEERPVDLVWTPFFALFRREIKRFLNVIFQTIATPLISTILYLLIFGVGVGENIEPIEGYPYLAFLIPGLMMMAILRNSFDNSSGSIITSKFCGDLEELRTSPLTPRQIVWAMSSAGLIRGFIVGMVTLLIGYLFFTYTTGSFLPIKHPFILLSFTILGGLGFANFGLLTAMFAKNLEQVSAIQTFILLPLIYLGGVFFSIDTLPPFWEFFSHCNPLLYMVNGIRYGLLGISDVNIEIAFLITLTFCFLSYFLALSAMKKGSYKTW